MNRLHALLPAVLLMAACSAPTGQLNGITLADTPAADGRWTIINYWAVWCHPCRQEIPELNDFARSQHDSAVVYGVNFDAVEGEELLVQANELGIAFTQLRTDPASQLGYAPPTVLPTTLVINPQGEIIARLIGPQTAASLEASMKTETL